jgi:Zn-dependent peptidase ImmA (M78 family)
MATNSALKRGFKKEAEEISEKYRAELGISKFAPLDAYVLAEHLNVPVFSVNQLFEGMEDSPAFLRMSDTAYFSAVWMPNEDGDKIILHNTNHSKKRQQSNIMHELSHIIRGHEVPDECARLCMQFNLHYYNKEHEKEARYLGACLQITRPGLFWSLKKNYTEEQISEYYNASLEMVRFRLNASGVLKQRKYMNKN